MIPLMMPASFSRPFGGRTVEQKRRAVKQIPAALKVLTDSPQSAT
jgi:hypothetical protein